MKLQEFFNTQKHASLTDIDKLDLYQNILYKKTKKTSLKRSSFVHAKYFVYTMVFVVLMMGTYGVYFINNGNLQDYNRFAIKSNTTNIAQADYIAQVIDVKGNFFIEHNGVLTTTNNIGNGDTILLKKGAQLVFEINSGTQSKIIGPAKLVIQKTTPENYKLNLIYGNFIQMEGKQATTQTIELAINDLTIKQQDKSKPLNFKFIKNGGNQIFQNNGANIVVTKSNGKDKITTISNNQVVAIQNNDIKVFANISTFTKAIQEKNISQTFLLADETTTSSSDNLLTSFSSSGIIDLLNTPQITENNQEITKKISSVLTDEKQILDPVQDEKVNASLYPEFYTPELKELESAFIEGNEGSFNDTYAKLEKRIQTIYQAFDIKYTKTSGEPTQKISGLKSAINNIQATITSTYSVPPKYIENLQSIAKSLNTIINKGYGSAVKHDAATGEIQE
ncbi:MAG: hypothetical protein WC606_03910 [Candidatus Absconditabacterales bacterium]